MRGWMGGWMDGRMGRWMDRQKNGWIWPWVLISTVTSAFQTFVFGTDINNYTLRETFWGQVQRTICLSSHFVNKDVCLCCSFPLWQVEYYGWRKTFQRTNGAEDRIKPKPQIVVHFTLPDQSLASSLWNPLKFQLLIRRVIDVASILLGFGWKVLVSNILLCNVCKSWEQPRNCSVLAFQTVACTWK